MTQLYPAKVCSICKRGLPLSKFYTKKNRKGKVNYRANCKDCNATNSDSIKKYYYSEKGRATRAKAKESGKKKLYSYKYRHSEKGKLATSNWLDNGGREKRRIVNRKYRRTPKGKVNGLKRAYIHRATGEHLLGELTPDDWQSILAQYEYRCAYCGEEKPLTQDHVIPISRNGRHDKDNVVPACRSCNSSKKERLLDEWKERPNKITRECDRNGASDN